MSLHLQPIAWADGRHGRAGEPVQFVVEGFPDDRLVTVRYDEVAREWIVYDLTADTTVSGSDWSADTLDAVIAALQVQTTLS